jgi:GNAT superfamily N-acetyltransferase
MTGGLGAASGREFWARGRGVALVPVDPAERVTGGLEQALRDGIERTYAGVTPAIPPGARAFMIEAGGETVGLLALRLDWPASGAATAVTLAIDPAARGHSYAARALFVAERALGAHVERWYATVPRTNGRGLYFMLRCGYAPLLDPPSVEGCAGVTWFVRAAGTRA